MCLFFYGWEGINRDVLRCLCVFYGWKGINRDVLRCLCVFSFMGERGSIEMY